MEEDQRNQQSDSSKKIKTASEETPLPAPSFTRPPQVQNALQRYEESASQYLPALAKDAIKYRVMELNQLDSLNQIYSFNPEHIGPFFSEDQKITGFRGLKAEVWLTPIFSEAYLKVEFEASINPDLLHVVYKELYGFSEPRLLESEEAFITKLKEEEKLRDVDIPYQEDKIVDTEALEIYMIDNLKNNEWFMKHSAPLQSLMMATVENISPLNIDEMYWSYYLVFSKREGKRVLSGFGTAYQFHRDALRYRARISQVIILPQFRGKGMGRILLETLYSYYIQDQNCFDITVQQANMEFHSFRDLTEVWLAIVNAKESLLDFIEGMKSGLSQKFDHFSSHWKKEWVLQIRQNVKIGRNRAERVAETIMMAGIDITDEKEYLKWEAGVSRRLGRVNRETLQPHRRPAKLMKDPLKHPMILFMSGTEEESKMEEEMHLQDHDEVGLYRAEMMRAAGDYKRALEDMVAKEIEGYTQTRVKILARLKK